MRLLLKSLGPGVITGAADDDPSGIATYSVAGAELGTTLLWTALLTWPLMSYPVRYYFDGSLHPNNVIRTNAKTKKGVFFTGSCSL
jgi:hypothetical protein